MEDVGALVGPYVGALVGPCVGPAVGRDVGLGDGSWDFLVPFFAAFPSGVFGALAVLKDFDIPLPLDFLLDCQFVKAHEESLR
jgi:MFS family permease